MKLQVNVSDEMCAEIDELAKSMGVSRSSLCAVWIGQALRNQKMTADFLGNFSDTMKAELLKNFDSNKPKND